jgi:hypothetical protein
MRLRFALAVLLALAPEAPAARAAAGAAPRARRGNAPVHVLARSRESLAASAGLQIVVRGTSQLESYPAAKAAILKAVARWESVITTPVTVVLDVDYGTTFFGAAWPDLTWERHLNVVQTARFPWSAVRSALVATADTPARLARASALPATLPSDRGDVSTIETSTAALRAIGLLPAVENPDAETALGPPTAVGFQDNVNWDFDPTDGIGLGMADFDAGVTEEIGHALGFLSTVGQTDVPPTATTLDVFRFRPSATPPSLTTGQRILTSGGDQVFYAGSAVLPLSTMDAELDGVEGVDPADHWKAGWRDGSPIGIMDPGDLWTGRVVMTSRDLAAMEAIGWKTVGMPPPEPSVRTIPIVLDAAGVGSSRYTTELVLSSRSIAPASVQLSYTAAAALGGQGSDVATTSIPAHGQILIPDALGWLRSQGVAIPTSGNQGGTLKVTFLGDDSPDFFYAGARTTSPSGTGRAGLSYAAVRNFAGLKGRGYVYGLRETASDRSNLALLNLGASPVTLRVTLRSGAGDGASTALPDVFLGPGQWTQLSRVLAGPGYTNGWATIDLVSGTGPYAAYGVFNDNVTNDGSYVPAAADPLVPETQYVPVIVESPAYSSELVVTNPSGEAVTATIAYVESLSPGGGAGGTATLSLAPWAQAILPSAVDWLRTHGAALGPKGAASYAGMVSVTLSDAVTNVTGLAGARTTAPGGGGAYGVFTPGVSWTYTDTWSTWVFGLRQDASTRSNLALVNVGDGRAALTLHVEIFDGDTGALAGQTPSVTIGPGGWMQFDAILAGFGVKNGFARVVYDDGSGSLIAYGVVNDGAAPSSGGTNDGSYVASSKY